MKIVSIIAHSPEGRDNSLLYMKLSALIRQTVCSLLLLGICFVPALVLADATTSPLGDIQNFPTNELSGLNKTGIQGSGTTQVYALVGRGISYALGFLGALALCIILYAGVRFMVSQGDVDQQKESLQMMLWAGVGITALLGSYALVRFVFRVL